MLAVCGAGLYFLRSFKPALARDYDVFFAAIGLLCGGILFFQGWRLDPILQFGQFLLAGTTVFFAYESVRLRGIATDQARKSSYFDDDPEPSRVPSGGMRRGWEDSYDQFDESSLPRRRFTGRESSSDFSQEDDFYQESRPLRRAIPEEAASRRRPNARLNDSREASSVSARRRARFTNQTDDLENTSTFGDRRNVRQDQRRGSRPMSNKTEVNRRSISNESPRTNNSRSQNSRSVGKASIKRKPEDAAFYQSSNRSERTQGTVNRVRDNETPSRFRSQSSSPNSNSGVSRNRAKKIRDNSSRFDD